MLVVCVYPFVQLLPVAAPLPTLGKTTNPAFMNHDKITRPLSLSRAEQGTTASRPLFTASKNEVTVTKNRPEFH